ncbi:MAG: hypothetical protein SV760_02495 [Halobacteria archaeon]|nr:hypothetical protein [Halobacteria archaeon]
MASSSTARDTQFEVIRRVIRKEGLVGEELTAREILDLVEDADVGISSAHEVATVLGSNSTDPRVQIIDGSPYRYKFS